MATKTYYPCDQAHRCPAWDECWKRITLDAKPDGGTRCSCYRPANWIEIEDDKGDL